MLIVIHYSEWFYQQKAINHLSACQCGLVRICWGVGVGVGSRTKEYDATVKTYNKGLLLHIVIRSNLKGALVM